MDFQKLCNKIDQNKSTRLHNYYQKVLAFLFIQDKDPFERELLEIDAEKRTGQGLTDLYLKWKKGRRTFTEIIEVEIQGKKKTLLNKIKLYEKKADLFSICIPSKNLDPLIKVFTTMKKDLPKINIVYLVDDSVVTKNGRKIVKDRQLNVGAQSPFMLINQKNFKDAKDLVKGQGSFLFDAFLPIYLE